MRSLVIAVSILLLTSALVICNSIVVVHSLDEMLNEIENAQTAEDATAAYEKYREIETFLALSIGDSQLSELDKAFIAYVESAVSGSDDLSSQKKLLISGIEEIRSLEGINLRSVA